MKTAALALAILLAAAFAPLRAESPAPSPIVVELFTSQGCSSCPPADAFLTELAREPGILALSLHVDYWNRLGWTDPFSSAEATARQRAYVRPLGGRYVYTPQMVVAGRAHAVGSDRAAVRRLIEDARQASAGRPALTLAHGAGGKLIIRAGAAPFKGRATLWLVAFDKGHATRVTAGENRGRKLAHSHVVRALRAVGAWDGAEAEITVDVADEMRAGYGYCAVLLQAAGNGPILAAAALPIAAH